MKEIKTIIFDIGGVLIHIDWDSLDKQFIKKFGFSGKISLHGKNVKEIAENMGVGRAKIQDFYKVVKPKRYTIKELMDYYTYLRRKYVKKDIKMYSLVRKLKKNYKVMCLTDTNHHSFTINKKKGVYRDFDRIFASHLLQSSKKDSKAFIKFFKVTGFKPEECLFIDNNKNHIDAASKLGMNSILFKNFTHLKSDLKKLGIG